MTDRRPIPCRIGGTDFPAVSTALRAAGVYERTTLSDRKAARVQIKAGRAAQIGGVWLEPR